MVVDAVQNDFDATAWNVEKSCDVVCSVRTHCDDTLLMTGEMLHHHSSIEHAGRVILVGHLKGCEVMDRGDLGTRSKSDHAPIAGHVNDIDGVLAKPAWQNELVPENIADRRPPLLSHWNQLHRVAGKFEEWQVILQDMKEKGVRASEMLQFLHQRKHVLRHPGFSPLDHGGSDGDFHELEAGAGSKVGGITPQNYGKNSSVL